VIDHRNQALGGVANVIDLHGDGVPIRACADKFGEHFGPPQDDAERILQVVRHGSQNLILEPVGPLQPQPLHGKPAIGLHQRARALRHAVFELRVGVLQLLIEDHVVECDRQPAAEDLHEGPIRIR
jgi:hypothetical protein